MIRIPELIVERMRDFAIASHANQYYGRHPYSSHLEQVYLLARDHGLSIDEQVAAWGHDLIEDTDVTREDIEHQFGPRVATLIWAVSGEGANRKERNQSVYAKLDSYPEAVNLKLCDRLANISSCIRQLREDKLKMYRKEQAEFASHVSTGHPVLLQQINRYLAMSEKVTDLSQFISPGAYSLAR